MLYPSIGDLIKGDNKCRYSLVTAVAKKTREIAKEAEDNEDLQNEKAITLAIRAFASGRSSFHEVREDLEDNVESASDFEE